MQMWLPMNPAPPVTRIVRGISYGLRHFPACEERIEIDDGSFKSHFERYTGLPPELLLGPRNIGAALLRIVDRCRQMDNARAGIRHADDDIGELPHRNFTRIAEIDRPDAVLRLGRKSQETVNEIVDIAEGARLAAIAINGDVGTLQCLHDEVGNNASVIRAHARPIGVEDASHLDIDTVAAVIIEKQRLSAAFPFIVASSRPDCIYITEIGFRLRIDERVAIDFRCRRLHHGCTASAGNFQHVDRAKHIGEQGADGIALIIRRRGRRGEVEDQRDIDVIGFAHIVLNQQKALIVAQMFDICGSSGRKIVEADHFVAAAQQTLAKVGAKETGTAINENALAWPPLVIDCDAVVMLVGNEITHYTLLPMRNQPG
ncbi:hypothetical protein AGR5A_Lc90192 [Agrobacterium genomosp. 5 str. CFBP 6626]|nr:hypothetical protein AGR5A_Lc90192 [Agrobacterium genomosp. 5 str. CFBP 6626]